MWISSGIIVGICSTNEKRRYIVTSSLVGWAYIQNVTSSLVGWAHTHSYPWVLVHSKCCTISPDRQKFWQAKNVHWYKAKLPAAVWGLKLHDTVVILKLASFKDRHCDQFPWSCPQVNATRINGNYVNIGSGNGLVPSDNKPLPEPMQTQFYVAMLLSMSPGAPCTNMVWLQSQHG